jgi:hypothetical protein
MECIYVNRCPNELSDLTADDERWFSLDIRRSESLRQLTAARHSHGWFQINLNLADAETHLERWTLLHSKPTREIIPFPTMPVSELISFVYRNFSRTLRAICSLLNALPTKTLEFALSQVPASNQRITAVCSQFHSKEFHDREFHCNGRSQRYEFGPVVTPIGECRVVCDSMKDLNLYLPQLPSMIAMRGPRVTVEAPSSVKIPFTATDFGRFSEDPSGSSSIGRCEFGSMPRDSSSLFDLLEFSALGDGCMNGMGQTDTIDEFCARIQRLQQEFPQVPELAQNDVRRNFRDVQGELRWLGMHSQRNAE